MTLNRGLFVTVPIAVVIILCLASAFVMLSPWRYGPAATERLPSSPDGAVWLQAARFTAGVEVAEEAGKTVLSLASNGEDRGHSLALYDLPGLPVDGAVRAAVEARAAGLRPGERDWEYAQVALWSLDRDGRPLWFWPKRILTAEGDQPWAWHEATIPLGGEVARMILVAYNGAAAGELALRGVRLQTVVERPAYRLMRWALTAGWALALLWLAWKLLRAPGRAYGKALLFAVLFLALAGILTPQPYFSQATKPLQGALSGLFPPLGPTWETAVGTSSEPAEAAGASGPAEAAGGGAATPGTSQPAADRQPGAAAGRHFRPPHQADEDYPITFKQVGHFLCFASLAVAAWLAFPQAPLRVLGAYLTLALLSTEVLQLFLVTRSSSWQDLLVDAAGVGSGLLAAALLRATPLARRLTARL